ncbi:hypothetical protein MASR1M12_40720 [Erysipelotrichia bacterium]
MQTSMQLENLELGKTYFWQIIAADDRGKETAGPIWRFSTHSPANRNPSNLKQSARQAELPA